MVARRSTVHLLGRRLGGRTAQILYKKLRHSLEQNHAGRWPAAGSRRPLGQAMAGPVIPSGTAAPGAGTAAPEAATGAVAVAAGPADRVCS